MKFTGVLVRPLAEQADRDGYKIDPAGVELTEDEKLILDNFSQDQPPFGVGRAKLADDGSIVVEGELTEEGVAFAKADPTMLAIGIVVEKRDLQRDGGGIVNASRWITMALTHAHLDPGQPPIRLLE